MADDVRQIIKRSGLSHNAVARGSGIEQPTITRFMNGQRTVTLKTAEAILTFFGVRLTKPRWPKGNPNREAKRDGK